MQYPNSNSFDAFYFPNREEALLPVSGVFHDMENILQRRYWHREVYDVKWHVM